MEKAKVYFTKEITSDGLVKIYEALNRELKGKVAVKISTGEMEESDEYKKSIESAIIPNGEASRNMVLSVKMCLLLQK